MVDDHRSRGFGPFSGAQLTVIICLVVAAVAVPVGAWAVAGSNVFVTDATTGIHAKVDSAGQMLVGDGTGSLTVDGTTSGRPLPPGSPFFFSEDFAKLGTFVFGPTANTIDITSMTVAVTENQGAGDVLLFAVQQPGTATSCNSGGFMQTYWHGRALTPGNLVVSFPTPLQIRTPAGMKQCIIVAGGVNGTLNASGFYGT